MGKAQKKSLGSVSSSEESERSEGYRSLLRQRKISKNSKKQGIKLGRPSPKQDEDFIIPLSEEETLIDSFRIKFMNYSSAIGMKKGFVFDESVRGELIQIQKRNRKNMPKIKWGESHFWDEEDENKKISTKIQNFKNRLQDKIIFSTERISEIFVEICGIFSCQITSEAYDFLLMALKCFLQKQFTQECFEEINNNFKILNPKFIKKKIKHKVELISESEIKKQLGNLLLQFIPLMEKVINFCQKDELFQ